MALHEIIQERALRFELNNRTPISSADVPPGNRCAMVADQTKGRGERQMQRFAFAHEHRTASDDAFLI